MTSTLRDAARELAEAVVGGRWAPQRAMARALLAALLAEPLRLDREGLAALICEWNEGDTLHQPTEEEVRLADFILARLEGRDSK